MLAVPPALLDILQLRPGTQVGIAMESGRMIIEPQPKPRYSLDELLAQCDPRKARAREDRQWLNGKAAGTELI
ncbi:MAG: antitoxin [Bryobacteraceae bacterium]